MNTQFLKRCLVVGGLCLSSAFAQDSAKAPTPTAPPGPLTPIASLNVARYMGTWYEIAKYPNYFQRKCVRNTRADYQLQTDGTVQVTNRCTQEDGSADEAVGAARQIGAATSPKLEVRFAPAWLSFLPAVWGNYWVIDLDADYQLVAVSEPKREYLWVLARTPQVSPEAYNALLQRLAQKGFDLQKLQRSPHTP
ncbi:MAG: lipocalin [Burkholderiales bacterium PBB3]|nr:MAG: lipocalin [Burkholderiales bacterium PBB3]